MTDANEADLWVLPPRRRAGSFAVFEFEGSHDRVPEMLETVAAWLRECAEYLLEQVTVHTDDGWSTVSVVVHELRPGDLMQQLADQGHADLAETLAAAVTEHGTREGLRRIGVAYQ